MSRPRFCDGHGALTYTRRGLPYSASVTIGSTTQAIVESIEYERDGLVRSLTYGDPTLRPDGTTPRSATVSSTTYDIRRRPTRMTTTRGATSAGISGSELGAVTTVVDQRLVWDAANNLTATIDDRPASQWPAGHRPQTTLIQHDSLYRVIAADFAYTQSDGSRTDYDAGSNWRDEYGETYAHDPMRQEPAPMVADTTSANRVVSLTWSWDYLANQTSWTDDQNAFYERSLGAITNGNSESDERPSALHLASNIDQGTGPGAGWVEVDYEGGGNVVGMTVHGQCVDVSAGSCTDNPATGTIESRRAALRAGCSCAVEQHYVYRWDELNRLAEARRYDREVAAGGAWVAKVRQRYRYDGANQRTVKQTLDEDDCGPTGSHSCERIALYPYPGDFERRGLVRGFDAYEADDVLGTETQYVVAGARMVWKHPVGGGGLEYDRDYRIAVPIGDLIQTTGAVFDVRTGVLLEASTYYPNGARETFLNDDTALTVPEVTGFTGKEADEEVGVVYFGERYLIPRLGRWASPDPLHVHAGGGGEALNSYHYVAGNLLAGRDPLGLFDGVELAEGRASGPAAVVREQVREEEAWQLAHPESFAAGAQFTVSWFEADQLNRLGLGESRVRPEDAAATGIRWDAGDSQWIGLAPPGEGDFVDPEAMRAFAAGARAAHRSAQSQGLDQLVVLAFGAASLEAIASRLPAVLGMAVTRGPGASFLRSLLADTGGGGSGPVRSLITRVMRPYRERFNNLALSSSERFQCQQAARDAVEALEGHGITGTQVVHLRYRGPGFVTHDAAGGGAISANGEHWAVQVGDEVFDNLHPSGVPRSEWEQGFMTPAGDFEASFSGASGSETVSATVPQP